MVKNSERDRDDPVQITQNDTKQANQCCQSLRSCLRKIASFKFLKCKRGKENEDMISIYQVKGKL